MNKCLIQVNDNYGAVSDENGNVRVISKLKNEASFEDILKKENNLTTLNTQLKDAKVELETNKHNIIMGEVLNLTIYGGVAALCFLIKDKVTPAGIVLTTGILYGSFKGLNLMLTDGTRIRKIKKRKKLKADIETLTIQIPELEKELEETKDNVIYDDNVTAVVERAPYKQIVEAMDLLSSEKESNNSTSLKLVRI